jgi:hypothetical protein
MMITNGTHDDKQKNANMSTQNSKFGKGNVYF